MATNTAPQSITGRRLKGVVFDVDGTLLDSRHRVPHSTRAVCAALVKRGIWLSIASARPPISVQQIAAVIGAQGPFCALNGAIILTRDGTIDRRLSMPQETAKALVARFKADNRTSLNVYSGRQWIVPQMDARVRHEADVVGFEPTILRDMDGLDLVEKILLMADEPLAIALTQTLAAENTELVVVRSNPCYVEITPAGVDKAAGAGVAAQLAGLSLGELVACGDGENDVTMLSEAGYGIAMAHGPQQLRDIAHQIVGSNDDGSLAAALEALFGQINTL